MAIKPVLFNDEMVRALLAGRKTQTRRPLRPIWHQRFARVLDGGDIREFSPIDDSQQYFVGCTKRDGTDCCSAKASYALGDVLWVREGWTPDHAAFYPHFQLVYRADFGPEYERNERGEVYSPEQDDWYPFRWRPSIHMPLSVARVFLKVTGVRCERLLDITDADAKAEGFESSNEFILAWDAIYDALKPDHCEWLFVYSFERCSAPKKGGAA